MIAAGVAESNVCGEGFLATHLAERMTGQPGTQPQTAGPLVLVAELSRLDEYSDILVECLGTGRPLLFVGTWRSFTYIGPHWVPGTGGCPNCLVTRMANSAFGPDFDGVALAEGSGRDLSVCTLGPAALRMVELYTSARSTEQATGDGSVIVVDATRGTVERQYLLPDSTCHVCGMSDADTTPVFTDDGLPLTKLAPDVLRTAELDADVVAADYLFSGLGLFKELRQDLQSPTGACSVELSVRWGRREPAIGRASSYQSSRTIAVLEGLERYAGLHRGGRRGAVRASYAEVADRALCPTELGTPPRESYRSKDFRFTEFDEDIVVDWVPAYSFRRGEPVLIPERSAFWGPRHDDEVCFTYDTSNGCALGNSVEEAILHGLREVAERDSFLLTWYRRLALPEINLSTVDGTLGMLLRKAALYTGFEFRAFRSTMEYGMPSVWLVAERAAGQDGPRILAGAGAHPDPRQAITGGLYELIGSVQATAHAYSRRREEGLAMLADPTLIRHMEDHSLVGALPEARERYAFLLDNPHETVELADLPSVLRTEDADLRADLDMVTSGVLAAGLDVLVVDQTMPELRRNGLSCVRVLVPGAVPMTFGHRNRRTENLPRLRTGAGLPYRDQLDRGEEIGCVPHPFP